MANLRWVAAGYALAAVAGVAVSWCVTKSMLETVKGFVPSLPATRAILTSALPFAVTGLATIVISRFDVVVLGLTGTRIEVGTYEPTLKVVEQAMLLVPLLFAAQYLPVASRAFVGRDRIGFRELYVGVSKIAFVIAFPAVVLFAAFPETILHALYGADFPASGLLVWLLLPGFAVNLAFGLNLAALAAVGDRRGLARTGAITTAAMVVLAVVLVSVFGATGAASATTATYVILNLVVAVELARTTGVQPFRGRFRRDPRQLARHRSLRRSGSVRGPGRWASGRQPAQWSRSAPFGSRCCSAYELCGGARSCGCFRLGGGSERDSAR